VGCPANSAAQSDARSRSRSDDGSEPSAVGMDEYEYFGHLLASRYNQIRDQGITNKDSIGSTLP
jgi:hypothetical protein